jgi:hypothetical protein
MKYNHHYDGYTNVVRHLTDTHMKRHILWFLTLILLTGSCQLKLNNTKTFIDDNIPQRVISEIFPLEKRTIDAIQQGRTNSVKDIISDALKEKREINLDSIFKVVSGIIIDSKFKKISNLYVENATINVLNTIFSGLTSDYDYILHYKALTKNVFISLNTAKVNSNELLLTLIYGKGDYGWKIYHIQFGNYSMYNKTAIDFYKSAKTYDSLGYLADAANQLFLAQLCIKPGNQLWQWQKESDIVSLQKSVMKKINEKYQFPLIVNNIKTKPKLLRIYPETFNDRYETMIIYQSQINIKDTTLLKLENLELRKEIGNIFKGIDLDKEYLLYRVLNELPKSPNEKFNFYGFVQECKNKK